MWDNTVKYHYPLNVGRNQENRIFFGKDGKGAPQLTCYLNEAQKGIVPTSWWDFQEVEHNDEANHGNIS